MFRHSYFNHHSPSTSPSSPPRSSRTTTPELIMLGGGRRGDGIQTPTTATSVYSDGLTEVPPLSTKQNFSHVDEYDDDHHEYDDYQDGIVKEGKLIDYDQEEETDIKAMEQNPTDKLRDLLKQMKQEIEITKPITSVDQNRHFDENEKRASARDHISGRKDWRKSLFYGNIRNGDEDVAGPSFRGTVPQRRMDHDNEQEADNEGDMESQRTDEEEGQEHESPPTPPPRIGNPYANRRGEQRRNSPNFNQPGRLPSRAAVLRNSTSRLSPSPEPPTSAEPEFESPPTRLEAFLASSTSSLPPPPHPSNPPYPAESSTSYSRLHQSLARRDSGSSSSSSRKGKNRAISPTPIPPPVTEIPTSRRNRYRHTLTPSPPPPELPHAENRSRRAAHTPRRISVDLAPEDLNSFARNAVDLEVRGEVELDLDEGFSGIGWEESSQSLIEEDMEPPLPPPTRHTEIRRRSRSRSISRSPERGERERSKTYRHRSSSPTQDTNSNMRYSQNHQSPPTLSHTTTVRQNRITPTPRPPHINRSSSPILPKQHSSPSPTLPALPEPDISANSDISEVDTYSSRRAALFRSTSKSASVSASTPKSNSRSISSLRDKSQSHSPSYGTPLGSASRLSNHRLSSFEKKKDEEEYHSPLPPKSTVSPLPERTTQHRSSLLPPRTEADSDSPVRSNQSSKRLSPSSESPQRIPVHPSSLKRYTPPRKVEDIPIPPQEPIQVNLALKSSLLSISTTPYPTEAKSTPMKSNDNPNLSTMPTPKPPGAWQSTPKGKVRFNPSPLGKSSPVRANTSQQDQEGVSIHRLRISPRRSPKNPKISHAAGQEEGEGQGEEVGNSSFLGKLAESISSPLKKARLAIPIPPKSTTFTIHTTSLEQAKSATQAAEQKLALTQKQWLEALSAINAAAASASGVNVDVGMVVKKSWGWGTWILWGLVEIVVIWSVFRVTIDYATSLTHLSSLDPFHPLALPFRQPSSYSSLTWGNGPFGSGSGNPIKLDITIPSALQTLVGKSINMRNANFFDLIESWGIWNNFGLGMGMGGGEGLEVGGGRILGGIPT